jgi:hypothetical protein
VKLALMAEEPGMSDDFKAKVTRLQELKTRHSAAEKKLEALRQFQEFIEPIKDPQNTIQPNLATRDGALAAELARSKTLGIRVAGRVVGIDNSPDENEDEDVVMVDQQEKVRSVLEKR